MIEEDLERISGEIVDAIAAVLDAKNAELEKLASDHGLHSDDYAYVGFTTYQNKPELDYVFHDSTVVFAQIEEPAPSQESELRSYKTARMASACSTYGACCATDGYRCKKIPRPGAPTILLCGRNTNC